MGLYFSGAEKEEWWTRYCLDGTFRVSCLYQLRLILPFPCFFILYYSTHGMFLSPFFLEGYISSASLESYLPRLVRSPWHPTPVVIEMRWSLPLSYTFVRIISDYIIGLCIYRLEVVFKERLLWWYCRFVGEHGWVKVLKTDFRCTPSISFYGLTCLCSVLILPGIVVLFVHYSFSFYGPFRIRYCIVIWITSMAKSM